MSAFVSHLRFRPLRFISAFSTLFICGCAHYQSPITHLESPETAKKGRPGRLELIGGYLSTSLDVEPVSKTKMVSGVATTEITANSSEPGFMTGYLFPIIDQLEIGFRMIPMGPLTLRGKYQFTGPTEDEAVSGDFSMAAVLGTGLLFGSWTGVSTTLFSFDVALPVGYRIFNRHLVFLTPFFNLTSLSGAAAVSCSRYGAGLGYQYTFENFFFRAEVPYAAGSLVGTATGTIGSIFPGAMIGLNL